MKKTVAEDTLEGDVENIRMSIGLHLEELRRRVIYSLIAVVFCFILCWFFKVEILDIAKSPHKIAMSKANLSTELQVLSYQEGFYAYMKLCFITAMFLAYPIIIYQIWRFVSVGLYKKEQRYILIYLPVSYVAFIVGGVFGYFLLIPFGLQFLIGILGPGIQPIITMEQYVSFVFLLTVALGLVFQLPLIMMLLSKIGFIKPEKFIAWRKYAILVIFIIAAVVTPPDPFTQTMTAVPMIILYELGILIARPSKKGFILLGTIVGAGVFILFAIFFYLTNKSGELKLVSVQGEVQFLYSKGAEGVNQANRTHLKRDIIIKTGYGGKTAFSIKKGVKLGVDANTEVQFLDPCKLWLKTGQIIITIMESPAPVEIDTPNGMVRANNGTINIQAGELVTTVTAVKGDATLLLEGEEKKLLEGRQHRMSIGGDPVDIGAIINWSEGVLTGDGKKD